MQPHPTGLSKLWFTVDHDVWVAIPYPVCFKQCSFKGRSVNYVAIAGHRTMLLLRSVSFVAIAGHRTMLLLRSVSYVAIAGHRTMLLLRSVSYVAIAGHRTMLLLLSHYSQYLRFTAVFYCFISLSTSIFHLKSVLPFLFPSFRRPGQYSLRPSFSLP